ncbi:hypothetical protein [Desulfosporosinus metallidurans]|uniref:Uncharacterized protein n=1 Tax=Desulfosporosinus metallidurans TaxID=1888891 RepID=A0A1Q8QFX5_9FIRM|nr:hypothetical protein [Desulfosporosinus metallidurans]OLN26240.1 hypothetical protein DSOL_5068 [Desulfosporosinus metallidurans]
MDIRTLENIEKAIFRASLENNSDIKELGKMYSTLIMIRYEVLEKLSEEDTTIEEVGEMWFKVTESILNVRIMIREQKGLDISQDVEDMEMLWKNWGSSLE